MGAFEYKALDKSGREKKGVMEGDAPRQVRQQLRDQGWIPLDVKEVVQREASNRGRPSFLQRGISATDLALITRQIATLVRAGLPLEECLVSQSTSAKHAACRSLACHGRPYACGGPV